MNMFSQRFAVLDNNTGTSKRSYLGVNESVPVLSNIEVRTRRLDIFPIDSKVNDSGIILKTFITPDHSMANLRFNRPSWQFNSHKVPRSSCVPEGSGEVAPSTRQLVSEALKEIVGELTDTSSHAECAKTKSDKVCRNKPEELCSSHEENLIISITNSAAFLEAATNNRTQSLALQELLASCSEENLHTAACMVIDYIPTLATHKFGSYVLARIVARSESLRKLVQDYTLLSFEVLVRDEFANRLMQSLAEQDPWYRSQITVRWCKLWDNLISEIAPVYLLTACVKASLCPRDLELVRDKLLSDPNQLLQSKYKKRVLVSFASVCNTSHLYEIYCALIKRATLIRIFNDKFLAYVCVELLTRGFMPMVQQYLGHLNWNYTRLSTTKYFWLVAQNLREADHVDWLSGLSGSLSRTLQIWVRRLSYSNQNIHLGTAFLCHLLLNSRTFIKLAPSACNRFISLVYSYIINTSC